MKNYFLAIRNYFNFNGKTSKKEYWDFFWTNLIIALNLVLISSFVMVIYMFDEEAKGTSNHLYYIFAYIYGGFMIPPLIAATMRRLNDLKGNKEKKAVKKIRVKKKKEKLVSKKASEDIEYEEVSNSGLTKFIFENRKISLSIMAFIIGITSFTLYYNTLDYDLVYCDDNIFVHDYQKFNKDIGNIWKSFDRTFGTSYYRPILGMSFVYDAWLGQKIFEKDGHLQPWVYQFTNNMLHVFGSILVFIFLMQLKYNPVSSFMFAMIFAVHPILTPAASWISGRNDSLITFFVLLSFISVLQFYRTKSLGPKIGLYIIHMILFAASFYTKEIAVFFPILIVMFNLTIRKGAWLVNGDKYKFNSKKFFAFENWALEVGWFAIFVIWYYTRETAFLQISGNPDNFGLDAFKTNLPTVAAMIGKFFVPIKMIALSTFEDFSIYTGILLLAGLLLLGFSNRGVRRRHFIFGFSWFFLFLIPTLFVRIYLVDDFFDYAEHRAYLIMSGIIIMLLELLRGYKINYNNKATITILSIVFLLFLWKSSSYKLEFDGRKNFWSHMTEMYPYKSRGYLDLGKAYLVRGELAEADSLYQLGLQRNPNNVNFYIDLGVIENQRKNYKKSLEYSKKAVKLKPRDFMTNFNLGNAFFGLNKWGRAGQFLDSALKYDALRYPDRKPRNLPTIHKAAASYHNAGNLEKAEAYYKYALSLRTNDYQVFRNYGRLLLQKNNPQEALKYLEKAVEMQPKDPANYNALLSFYLSVRDKANAMKVIQRAQSLNVKLNKNMVRSAESL